MTAPRRGDGGFTLIETLVALAVLAVGSVTLLTGVERHAAATRGLSDRILARWVAENAIAAATLGLPMQADWTRALGVEWAVTESVRRLPGSGLQALTVNVAETAAGRDASLVSMTGYLAIAGAAR